MCLWLVALCGSLIGAVSVAPAGVLDAIQPPAEGKSLFERVWTPAQGLGPLINAQACTACHTTDSPSDAEAGTFVLVSPELRDVSGGQVFQQFAVLPNGRTTPREVPRLIAKRRPPSLAGLGLLEAVEGRGGFGWKGSFPTIDAAVDAAFANEMGLLSPTYARHAPAEISTEDVRRVAHFIRALPPPASRPRDAGGSRIFARVGCAECHTPTQRTGDSALADLRFRLVEAYTDLQVHDMGAGLSDGWDNGGVKGSAFRTPPLWGLSLNGPPFLHDGRARTVEEAVELHGGEGLDSVRAFRALSKRDRRSLLRFVETR